MKTAITALPPILLAACLLLPIASCGGDGDGAALTGPEAPDHAWTPVPAHREQRDRFTVVWLEGSPYEMGRQQGELLRGELAAGIAWLRGMFPLLPELAVLLGNATGLTDLAMRNAYPDIVEECRGLSDAAGDTGWSMELCMLLNFGDVAVEFLEAGFPGSPLPFPQACSQLAAAGPATPDGRLYHARVLDWDRLDFLLDYPVIFVRQPDDGIPHAFIGFPGNLSPYSGMNAAGLSLSSDEADPLDQTQHDLGGRSHVQMQGHLLKHARSLAEARALLEAEDHMTVEIIVAADGNARDAAVFEMTSQHLGVRGMDHGVVFATNHFEQPETRDWDAEPAGPSSLLRFRRLGQLAEPGGPGSLHGTFTPQVLVDQVLRDRTHPDTGEVFAPDVFDNGSSIATNGALYQIVFDPERLLFWVAAGGLPVPSQPFVGFSLGELLGLPGAAPCSPERFPEEIL